MFQFIGDVFTALIGRPIFNLLIIIIALLPGHNLGWAIIIFTILVRLALYPLLKKQLHHAVAMRKLQPDIKRIKKETKGDRQREYAMMQELYKEREVKPMASIGILLAQLPILLALFFAINTIVREPETIVSNAYSWVQNLPFIQELASDISKLDTMWLGFVDLTQSASGDGSVGAFVLVIGAVVVQYFQSKQLMMTDKDARGLKQILKDSSQGKEVDQTEVQAATSKFTLYIIPLFLFFVAINLPAAISLYWFAGGIIALIQQTYVLKKDVQEMEDSVVVTQPSKKPKKPIKAAKEAEIVAVAAKPNPEPKVNKKTGVKTYIKTDESATDTKKTKSKPKTKSKKGGKKSKKKRR